ncbi:MAG: hypothetical protein AAF348_17875 [Bacteroidota bacterium]
MIDNIKNMWGRMLQETKHEAVQILMDEYDHSKVAIKQNWIYQGMIPEEKQPRVVEIFQNLLVQQEKKTKKLIS